MKNIGIQIKDENNNNVYPNPFPVGAIYMSVDSRNPSSIFGGTWEQIKDKFLLSAGDTYKAGNSGGEASVKLNTNQIPSHAHSGSTSANGNHNHKVLLNWDANFPLRGYPGWTGGQVGQGMNMQTSYNGFNVGTSNDGNHNHTFTTSNTGGNQSHNNMPPYLVVYVWRRVS